MNRPPRCKRLLCGTPDAAEVVMPLHPPCDDAGNPMDCEQHQRIVDREYAAREAAEFRVQKYRDPENPKLVAFRVVDQSGVVRGRIAFEWAAMEIDLPERALARVQRGAQICPRPDLKLVG
jgi:hypothetical protein